LLIAAAAFAIAQVPRAAVCNTMPVRLVSWDDMLHGL
jgi:hypothetical protein